MNPASDFTREEWSNAVANISRQYDTAGVYSDQISCSHAEACYAENGTNASSWAQVHKQSAACLRCTGPL